MKLFDIFKLIHYDTCGMSQARGTGSNRVSFISLKRQTRISSLSSIFPKKMTCDPTHGSFATLLQKIPSLKYFFFLFRSFSSFLFFFLFFFFFYLTLRNYYSTMISRSIINVDNYYQRLNPIVTPVTQTLFFTKYSISNSPK